MRNARSKALGLTIIAWDNNRCCASSPPTAATVALHPLEAIDRIAAIGDAGSIAR